MLRAAIVFFVLGLVSMLFGAYGIAGVSIEAGKLLLTVFVIIAVVSFVVSLITGKKPTMNTMAFALMLAIASGPIAMKAFAEETVKSDAKELGNDVKRGTNKAVRTVKDKTCEMINGKMECAVKKAKHSIQNGADKVEDAVE
jgi:uncharacterized membrane protein YtjA (UPF0391 family)